MHFPTSRNPRARVAVAVLSPVLWLLAGCGDSGASSSTEDKSSSSPPSSAGAATIVIENFAFAPATLAVAPGATVTVVNRDTAAHTVTADKDKAFDTGRLDGGATTTFVAPNAPGDYGYLCTFHQYMKGTLAVT